MSDKIQFCSCSSKSYDSLSNYWILHRFVGEKDIEVIGEVVLPYDFLTPNYNSNKNIILTRLNEQDSFDAPLNFNSKDILEIVLNSKSDETTFQLTYTFEYSNGKWIERSVEPFELTNRFQEMHFGEIKSAFDKNSQNLP